MSGMEGTKFADKIKEVLTMAGPGFGVGSNLNLNIKFNEMDEIKAHPMASHLLITLDQILGMVAGTDKESLYAWTPDFSAVPKEDLDKHIEGSEYCKDKKKMLDFIKLNTEILADFDENAKGVIKMCVFETIANQITIAGHGYGEMISFIVQMFTFKFRKECVESIISDFNNTKEESEKKDEMMDAPKEDAPMEEMMMSAME